jgi:hypothetical protein
MANTHPAQKLLRYLARDDQLEMDIKSIESDPDFQALLEMDNAELDGEIGKAAATHDLEYRRYIKRLTGFESERRRARKSAARRRFPWLAIPQRKWRGPIKLAVRGLNLAFLAILVGGHLILYSEVKQDEGKVDRVAEDMAAVAGEVSQKGEFFDQRFLAIETKLTTLNSTLAELENNGNSLRDRLPWFFGRDLSLGFLEPTSTTWANSAINYWQRQRILKQVGAGTASSMKVVGLDCPSNEMLNATSMIEKSMDFCPNSARHVLLVNLHSK